MVEPNPPLPYGAPWHSNPVRVPASGPPNSLIPVTSAYPMPEPVIAQIGEIQVTSTTVHTPAGQFPLKGSQWTVTDQWVAQQKIPTWPSARPTAGSFALPSSSLPPLLPQQ